MADVDGVATWDDGTYLVAACVDDFDDSDTDVTVCVLGEGVVTDLADAGVIDEVAVGVTDLADTGVTDLQILVLPI